MAPESVPYYLPQAFAPLRAYERQGLSARSWVEDQFGLEVVGDSVPGSGFEARCRQVIATIDRLPLQVKDLLRGTIQRIRLERGENFAPGTLGTWKRDELRLNADWTLIAPLRRRGVQPGYARHLIQATLVHECGHALVEDPRGGVPMGSVLTLLAASGWLPHPAADPTPFRDPAASVDSIRSHYLRRLQGIDSRWDPARPLGSPGTPPASQLDRDLMGSAAPAMAPSGPFPGSVGLRAPTRLARELITAASEGRLEHQLSGVGLSLDKVRAAVSRYQPVSPYAEEEIAETPAEIFRWLHATSPRARTASPALAWGQRLLVGPWREAELELGPRLPARMPTRAIPTAQRGR